MAAQLLGCCSKYNTHAGIPLNQSGYGGASLLALTVTMGGGPSAAHVQGRDLLAWAPGLLRLETVQRAQSVLTRCSGKIWHLNHWRQRSLALD